ncbi:MAG: OadG family protein [Lachnospiraceae bacterium]|jgi:sodium pump decarboxylase gamma subunit|nr:OadG family protein [Lachnospiraceae bacterium]
MTLYSLITAFFLESNAGEDITYAEAGLNTAMGLGIVFCALAFISLVITLEGKIFGALGKKKAAPKTPEVPVVAAPAELEEVEDESDDTELVAVITAAIYAYEAENGGEVPADGLVVRSIRRLGLAR